MTRREALKAMEKVLMSAMHDEKNKALFQSQEWARHKFHFDRAKSCLSVIEADASASGFYAFDFDVSIAELRDFVIENNLGEWQ